MAFKDIKNRFEVCVRIALLCTTFGSSPAPTSSMWPRRVSHFDVEPFDLCLTWRVGNGSGRSWIQLVDATHLEAA